MELGFSVRERERERERGKQMPLKKEKTFAFVRVCENKREF